MHQNEYASIYCYWLRNRRGRKYWMRWKRMKLNLLELNACEEHDRAHTRSHTWLMEVSLSFLFYSTFIDWINKVSTPSCQLFVWNNFRFFVGVVVRMVLGVFLSRLSVSFHWLATAKGRVNSSNPFFIHRICANYYRFFYFQGCCIQMSFKQNTG